MTRDAPRLRAVALLLLLVGTQAGRGGGGGRGGRNRNREEPATDSRASPATPAAAAAAPAPASLGGDGGSCDSYQCGGAQGRCVAAWRECGGSWEALAARAAAETESPWRTAFLAFLAGFAALNGAGVWLRRKLGALAAPQPSPLRGSEAGQELASQ